MKSSKTILFLIFGIIIFGGIYYFFGFLDPKNGQVVQQKNKTASEKGENLKAISGNGSLITKISSEKRKLDFKLDDGVNVFFTIENDSHVEINWMDRNRNIVRTITHSSMKQGDHTVSWDGKDITGKEVPDGVYIYTIKSIDNKGKEYVFDPSEEQYGKVLPKLYDMKVTDKGLIEYSLPSMAMVRMRIELKKGPLLATAINWEPMMPGKYMFTARQFISEDVLSFINKKKMLVNVYTYMLPVNCVIVENSPVKRPKEIEWQSYKAFKYTNNFSKHANHRIDHCRDLSAEIELTPSDLDENGDITVKGPFKIKLDSKPDDKIIYENDRAGAKIYLDGIRLYEVEHIPALPFSIVYDPKELNPGKHLLTVVIRSYYDHIGTKSMVINYKPGV